MKTKGFTLIELLVVISIIGLLSSIVFASLNSARIKARDARRIADIKQIQMALDLYYDQNNTYPVSGNCNLIMGVTVPNDGWCNSIQSLSSGYWIRNGLSNSSNLSTYFTRDPVDCII